MENKVIRLEEQWERFSHRRSRLYFNAENDKNLSIYLSSE